MSKWLAGLAILLLLAPVARAADELRVETLKQPAPEGKVSAEIAAQLSPTGYKVLQGERTIAEIWPAKQWTVNPGFSPSLTINYPLQIGSLVGVLRFPRKGADFRGQDIPAGVYTLRYANQPEDGNHVGTFETRDFLVMISAANDESAAPVDPMELNTRSAEAAESSHPAIMPLLKPKQGEAPAVRHIEEMEWWALHLEGKTDQGSKQPLEVIVQGKAAE